MPNRSPQRIRQFKLLAALLFSLPAILLVYLLVHVLHLGSNADIAYNNAVNRRNFLYSKGNSFGFTDIERTTAKPKGVFRIAVLGDSYIWGDGLPYEKAWSHKLEKKLRVDYDSLEVLHWGFRGWSTLDEFNFFKEHGKDFNVDLLIIGWVCNDPDLGNTRKVLPGEAEKEFPTVYKISSAFANVLLRFKKNYEYSIWMGGIYSKQNLKDYQLVLNQFHNYLAQSKVNVLCVMTPGRALRFNSKKDFDIARPLIIKAGFPCFDLYPPVEKKLGHYPIHLLMANPVNGHPSELMTEEFATDVKNYLEQNHYLDSLPTKKL